MAGSVLMNGMEWPVSRRPPQWKVTNHPRRNHFSQFHSFLYILVFRVKFKEIYVPKEFIQMATCRHRFKRKRTVTLKSNEYVKIAYFKCVWGEFDGLCCALAVLTLDRQACSVSKQWKMIRTWKSKSVHIWNTIQVIRPSWNRSSN